MEKTNCYRLYEKDIPEYPYIVDVYAEKVVLYEKGISISEGDHQLNLLRSEHLKQIKLAIQEVLEIPEKNIFHKTRERKKGKNQYLKNKNSHEYFEVCENDMKFRVNLQNYLDTGIFLDHRPLRKWIKKEARGKRVLNLFSYTGTLSVAAALGGGKVTTIDMSKTYLDWAIENFHLNKILLEQHHFIQADIIQYLKEELSEMFDLVVLDPPSFSNSKRMDDIFEVQRDHSMLIDQLMSNLNKGGSLYFSNNLRKFKLSPDIYHRYQVEDLTASSIPKDFRDQKIHVCFKITH